LFDVSFDPFNLDVLFFFDFGTFSVTSIHSSTLLSALLSYNNPDLVSSKLNVTLGNDDPFFYDTSLFATSSIPFIT
jgi:hypothetical protein